MASNNSGNPVVACGCWFLAFFLPLFALLAMEGYAYLILEPLGYLLRFLWRVWGAVFWRPFSFENALLPLPWELLFGGVFGIVVSSFWRPAGRTRRRVEWTGGVAVGLGAICLLSAIGMTWNTAGDLQLRKDVPPMGGQIGPISVEEDGTLVQARVEQSLVEEDGGWSFVTVELLDEQEAYLSGFGGEFWWVSYEEAKDEIYRATLRIPSAGAYYVRLQTETNLDSTKLSPIRVELAEKDWRGNPHPLLAAGHLALLFGITCVFAGWHARSNLQSDQLLAHLEDGARIHYRGRVWSVWSTSYAEYDDWQTDEWTLMPIGTEAKTPRYLEREYEADSEWEDWFVSRPIAADEATCPGPDGEPIEAREYAAAEEEMPDSVTLEGTDYELEYEGTFHREGSGNVYYVTYEDEDGNFFTVEAPATGGGWDTYIGGPLDLSEVLLEPSSEEDDEESPVG